MHIGRIAVSAVAALLLAATSPALAAGIAERESVGSAGQQADGYSVLPSVSGDGTLVAFNTAAHNLVAKDPNRWSSDILVRDRVGRTTSLVSVSTAGLKANGRNGVALISRDGKRVAFESAATNLADGDTNGAVDVFVRDLGTGTTSRASLGPLGRQAGRGSSLAALSHEGRHVAFLTSDNLLGLPGPSAANLYVRDTATGQTTLETASLTGGLPNGGTSQAAMSGDGRYLAFASRARNLLKVTQRGSGQNLFLRDRQLGVTKLVSVTASGGAVSGYYVVDSPRVSDNGRIVAFSSDAPGLVQGGSSGHVDVFVRDMAAGTTTRMTSGANGDSFVQDMTPDGRYLVVLSSATNLVPGDTNGKADIFVYDRQAGTVTRASTGARGQADDDSLSAAVSTDGKVVAFASRAANLVNGDTNGVADVFARVTSGPGS